MGKLDIIAFVVYSIELKQLLMSTIELLTLSLCLKIKFPRKRQYSIKSVK